MAGTLAKTALVLLEGVFLFHYRNVRGLGVYEAGFICPLFPNRNQLAQGMHLCMVRTLHSATGSYETSDGLPLCRRMGTNHMLRYFNKTVLLLLAGFFFILPLISRPLLADSHWSGRFRGLRSQIADGSDSDLTAPLSDPADPCVASDGMTQ